MQKQLQYRFWTGKQMLPVSGIDFQKQTVQCNQEVYAIDDGVLMQCTGIKDFNGNYVYEYDFIEAYDGIYCIVEWNRGGFILRPTDFAKYAAMEFSDDFPSLSPLSLILGKREVIGNLWQYPEINTDNN